MIPNWQTMSVATLLVALQWGLSEFISVQFILFLFALLYSVSVALRYPIYLVPSCILLFLLLGPTLAQGGDLNDFMRVIRMVLTAFILITITRNNDLNGSSAVIAQYGWQGLNIAIVVNIVLGLAQLADALSFQSGAFDIPAHWFAFDYGTHSANIRETAFEFDYFYRPSGTYSEPSALGALALLGMVVSLRTGHNITFALSAFLALLTCSLATYIFGAVIILNYMYRNRTLTISRIIILILCAAAVIFILAVVFQERIALILSGEDLSYQIRLGAPLKIIASTFMDGQFFGLDRLAAEARAAEEVFSIVDNWFLNILLFYGVAGLAVLVVLFACLSRHVLLLFVIYGFLNGDALYYDRIVLILLFSFIVLSIRAKFINVLKWA